ncbi:DNA polymerase III subunit gamma/tau [Gordonibacter sp.]|uniref:DNA polymerase III subunit gamma/tau n=1 Tax=Gordonibacter sp. TaxID=1968902 RepID=UPI002FCC5850
MAEALYRKYRPQIFEDVVGQEHIERTIKNAIEQDKVSHAYLFTGPRGTGKTTTARLLAKALLCEHGPTPEPDGTCSDCKMIANGEHPDVYELDAASRTGVENVREEIIGRVQYAPTRGRYKIYIIDEVHMLSTAAFNALLKTLEEPPSHVVFILATTDPQKVPETIHSRCQRFDFRRISLEAIVSRLGAICVAEDVEFEGEALDLIAHRAEGGMRNALTSLEQLIAFGEGKVTLEVAERMLGAVDTNDLAEIVRAIGTRDVALCFRWTAEYIETGADLAQFTRDLAEHVRNMYVMTLVGADVAIEVGEAMRRELAQEMQWFGADRLARLLGVLGDLSAELKTSTNPRLSFEIALTRMVRPDSDLTLESLAERVEALESGYSAVAHVTGGPAPVAAQQASVAQTAASMPMETRTRSAATLQEQACSAPVAATPADAALPVSRPLAGAPVEQAPSASQPQVAPATATPAAAAPSADLAASLQNPAALQRIWQATLSALKKSKAAYGVLFLNTKAIYDAGGNMLAIEFPAENSFAFKAVQKPDVQEAVSAALAQSCGAVLPFSYTQGSGGVSVSTSVAPASVVTPQQSACAASRPAPMAQTPSPSAAVTAGAGPLPTTSAMPVASSSGARPALRETGSALADTYDLPPYDDEVVPYGDEMAAQGEPSSAAQQSPQATASAPRQETSPVSHQATASAPWEAASSASAAPTPQQVMTASAAAPAASSGFPSEPDTRTAPAPEVTGSVQSPEEIEAILTIGFGEGIVFEEVKE